jgi:hypothetical protein
MITFKFEQEPTMKPSRPRRSVLALAALLLGVLGTVSFAGPRDSLQLTNVRLDDTSFPPVSTFTTVAVAANYTVRYATIAGRFTVDPGGGPLDVRSLVVYLGAPSGEAFTIHPFRTSSATQSTTITPAFVIKLPPAVNSVGTWIFGISAGSSGIHAQWDTLTATLNDGPPVVPTNPLAFPVPTQPLAVLGNIGAPGVRLVNQQLPASGALWYRIDLPVPIATINTGFFPLAGFLDIDTEGSGVSASLGFYDFDGALLATDYFSGSLGGGGQAQLSFGTAPARPGVGNAGSSYNNRNGTLEPGVYYIAVARFTAQYDSGWSVRGPAAGGGAMTLNVVTNLSSSPICPADFNRSGTLSVQDIFDYLNAWFAGC